MQLGTDKLGQSVDECDALLKKHETFERLIASQEEKVCHVMAATCIICHQIKHISFICPKCVRSLVATWQLHVHTGLLATMHLNARSDPIVTLYCCLKWYVSS